MTHRGTSNTNVRGSSYDRRRRKQWLLDTFGDGITVVCSFEGCEKVLTFATMTVDRSPLAGIDGGTYRRGNIRPACGPCNSLDGTQTMLERRYGYEDQF